MYEVTNQIDPQKVRSQYTNGGTVEVETRDNGQYIFIPQEPIINSTKGSVCRGVAYPKAKGDKYQYEADLHFDKTGTSEESVKLDVLTEY